MFSNIVKPKKQVTPFKKKSRGMTLLEIVIAVGVAGTVAGIALYYQSKIQTARQANNSGQSVGYMVSKIKEFYKTDFTGLNNTAVNGFSIVNDPLIGSAGTANITDAWGNAMFVFPVSFNGVVNRFGITLGGPSGGLTSESCSTLISRLSDNANSIIVTTASPISTAPGSAVTQAASGALSGGVTAAVAGLVKAPGGTFSPSAAATLCSSGTETTRQVVAIFG